MVDEALRAYSYAPENKPEFTNPAEIQDAIRGLKFGKGPGPNGIPNRALKHLPQGDVFFLVKVFNTILLMQYFPCVWKHDRVISILKPGKEPALPSLYRPMSITDKTGKLFEKSLLSRALIEVKRARAPVRCAGRIQAQTQHISLASQPASLKG
jgi:hypothetical protein